MDIKKNKTLLVILGNQLFPLKHIKNQKPDVVFMREDIGLCTYQKHHKKKIFLFLESMRQYRDQLENNNIDVYYEELNLDKSTSYIDSLSKYVKNSSITNIKFFEIEDKPFMLQIEKSKFIGKDISYIDSPMFLTRREEFKHMCPPRKSPKYKMTDFYINQRKKLNILIDNKGKPEGGKWSYDTDNRKKIPKDIKIPSDYNFHKENIYTDTIKNIVNKKFMDHPGQLDDFQYPTTRKDALAALNHFIKEKFNQFGDYEDSVDDRSPYWFHSVLSSSLNIGLITPDDILSKINNLNNININSYEGFIRQIIGWREFMRCLYHQEGDNMKSSNFFSHERKMTDKWYTGNTGLDPLDYSIKSTIKHAYSHHIERLMIQVNIMNLCEIYPTDAYNWFMELYIDSSDWVMVPNVYSMGLFADGGIMATKPYICGSNYMIKMMNFKKGPWCDILDGLYWRFINKNRIFFKTNHRLNMMVHMFDKIKPERKKDILDKAESFINNNTK